MKTIAWLHGLNSSHKVLEHLADDLPDVEHHFIDYPSHQPLSASIEFVKSQLPSSNLILAGHSLGGVIAALLACELPQVKGLITISAPFRGSRAAAALRWLPGALSVLNDIVPTGPLINKCVEASLSVPTLNLISTDGHVPFSPERNDGVITISSQRGIKFGKHVEVPANHFDILSSEVTKKHICDFLRHDVL